MRERLSVQKRLVFCACVLKMEMRIGVMVPLQLQRMDDGQHVLLKPVSPFLQDYYCCCLVGVKL